MPDEAALKRAIDQEAQDAYGDKNDELNQERAKALDYYLARPLGNEIEGRSQIVAHSVMDTIEWQKPSLMRIFTGSDTVIKFEPTGPEDVPGAKQESEYVNYILTQKNNWFTFCYDWISDALITRNAYALAYWDEDVNVTLEQYQGLTDDQLAFIAQDIQAGRVEIIGHNAYPANMPPQQVVDPMTQQVVMLPPPTLHDVAIRKVNGNAFAKICVLPPERCMVSQRCKGMSVQDSPYFEYWDMKTISELREMGFDVPDDLKGHIENENEEVDQARQVGDIFRPQEQDTRTDPAMRRVKVRMIWIRFDYDQDGLAELNYCVRVGDTFLHREEVDTLPIAAIVPVIMPHRHIGLSTADQTHDLQELDTMLQRGMIDNLFEANNSQTAISNKVNLEDMLTSLPGGIKRVDTDMPDVQGHILPYKQPIVIQDTLAAMEFFKQEREARTGTSRYSQGADLNALNRTASGIAQLSSAASQRLELTARIIADGMRELFRIVHEITLKHSRMAETVMLNNEWVTVDPRQWKKRMDMTVSVGLGVANREQLLANLNIILQQQMALIPTGIIRPENVYHTFSEMVRAAGFAASEQFVTDPKKSPPPQPQPDPIELGKLQVDGFNAVTQRMKANADSAQKAREPVENAMDRKLDIVLAQTQAAAQPRKTADGESKAPNINVSVFDPDKMEKQVADIRDQLIAHLDAASQQVIEQALAPMREKMAQVEAQANRKRKLVPKRGKRGRIESLEEAD